MYGSLLVRSTPLPPIITSFALSIFGSRDSVNIFDTDLSYIGRTFNKEGFIKLAKETIGNFKNKVELPKCKKVPIVTKFFEVGSKVINELDGNKIGSKASIF